MDELPLLADPTAIARESQPAHERSSGMVTQPLERARGPAAIRDLGVELWRDPNRALCVDARDGGVPNGERVEPFCEREGFGLAPSGPRGADKAKLAVLFGRQHQMGGG